MPQPKSSIKQMLYMQRQKQKLSKSRKKLKKNEVEDYLKENLGKILSIRKICKDTGLKRRKAIWLIHQSENIRCVDPLEVGSGRHFLHVYTYVEDTN